MNTATSPCIKQCCLNKQDICVGCFRSLTEITEWSQASTSRKEIILENIALRRKELKEA